MQTGVPCTEEVRQHHVQDCGIPCTEHDYADIAKLMAMGYNALIENSTVLHVRDVVVPPLSAPISTPFPMILSPCMYSELHNIFVRARSGL